MSTCGARPGEKIKSLASLAAAIMDAISAGVRTTCVAGRPGAALPGTTVAGGAVDVTGGTESGDGAASGLVACTSGVKVGASIEILRRVPDRRISESRRNSMNRAET